MLVSIYGTVYNNIRTINRSLLSLARVLPNFDNDYELVIVDNYSTDGTFKVLKKFAKKHKNIKIIRTKCTRGRGRDIALKNTSGDYVFYVDFDNIFKKEFGIIIEKLRRVCSPGTIWSFGFSTRDTSIEMIGGWKDLNYGEDWEITARALTKGVRVKRICTPGFFSEEKVRMREARYAESHISYKFRKFRNIVDFIRGYNPNFAFFKEKIISGKIFRPSSLMAISLFPISKIMAFKHDKKLCNAEVVYKKEDLVFPEDIGLPKDWFLMLWEHAQWFWPIIKGRIKELRERDEKLQLIFFKKDDVIVCTRNINFIKRYLNLMNPY